MLHTGQVHFWCKFDLVSHIQAADLDMSESLTECLKERHLVQQHAVLDHVSWLLALCHLKHSFLTFPVMQMPNVSGTQRCFAVSQTHLAQHEETQADVLWKLHFSWSFFFADVSFPPHRKWMVCAFWFGLRGQPGRLCAIWRHAWRGATIPGMQSRSSRQIKNTLCRLILWVCTRAKTPCVRTRVEILL